LITDDGISWQPIPTGEDNALTGVAWHDGKFVAVSTLGFAVVRDAGQWTSYDVGLGYYLWGVAYTNDRFIALGNVGKIATSIDGTSWQPHDLGVYALKGAAYGNGKYVLAGSDIFYSTDASNWTHAASAGGYEYSSVVFGKGVFVAAGGAGIATSQNGVDWDSACPSTSIVSLVFDGSKFVAVGDDAFVSFDGRDWRRSLLHSATGAHAVGYLNGQFVAVSEYGGIQRSADELVFSGGFDGSVCPFQ